MEDGAQIDLAQIDVAMRLKHDAERPVVEHKHRVVGTCGSMFMADFDFAAVPCYPGLAIL